MILEDLKTVNSWCCCVDLRLGCIFSSLIATFVYLVLAIEHMLELKPGICYSIVFLVVSLNTLLIVGVLQENRTVMKTYMWMSLWTWLYKAICVIFLLMATKFYGTGDFSMFMWYIYILCIDIYFWVTHNSYYMRLVNEPELLEPV